MGQTGVVIDPRTIVADALDGVPKEIEPAEYDEHEPLVIEAARIGPEDIEILRQIPFALDGCVVVGCDLSLTQVRGIKNSRIENSKLRGATFANYVRNAAFVQSRLTECTFRMMAVKDVIFLDCQLTDCDFYGTELSRLKFDGSAFEGVGFDACTIDELDLTGATDLLIGDPRTLVGATICETQVPLIAERLAVLSGINVNDC